MLRMSILFVFLSLVACAPAGTPEYGIHVEGNYITQVDTAWEIANSLVSSNPHATAKGQWIVVEELSSPIDYDGKLYSGLTSETMSRIVIKGNPLCHSTPMVHELLHVLQFIRTGDNDAGHVDPAWKKADGDFVDCN